MEHGNYARFAAENRQAWEQCKGGAECAVALFNLGFVYAYPKSPYYDPTAALWYFGELCQKYPQTPWAFQGQAWMAFLNERLALEDMRRRLQAELRTREVTIRSLQERLKRARDIDLQLEKKERELLR
jgi:hypothetical protein